MVLRVLILVLEGDIKNVVVFLLYLIIVCIDFIIIVCLKYFYFILGKLMKWSS